MILLSLLAACELIDILKYDPDGSDTEADYPASGSVYSTMPYTSEQSKVDWNCDFLTNMENIGQTGLEEYGVIAIHVIATANLYAGAMPYSEWSLAPSYPEVVDGEVLYDGLFYPMGPDFMPGYLTAAVSHGPVDMSLCRGYLWIE